MKKVISYVMVVVLILLPLLVGTVAAAQTQNPNFPDNAPPESNHVIIFDDGTWVTVDDMVTPPTGATMGWRHESRDGSPPPWEGQGGQRVYEQNRNFPGNVPTNINHIVVFPNGEWGGWISVEGMYEHPAVMFGANLDWPVGWFHMSRDGSPPPWEGNGQQVVSDNQNVQSPVNQTPSRPRNLMRISEVLPASESVEPSNGVFAGIAREFARDALTRQVPSANIDIGRTLSTQEQQTSDNLFRQFVESFDIESVTGALGVNEDGFAIKMDGITIRTYTAEEGAQLGGWDASTRTAWVATHIRQADGRVVPRTIEEISNVLLYEVFGRSNGFGMTLSVLMTEVLNGETEPSNPGSDLFFYTGLYHQIGAERVLAMAKQLDEEQFQDWMNIQIRELNSNFSFDYAQMQMLRASAGAAARSENARTQFAGQMGMPANQVRNQLEGMWSHFYSATDPNVSANVGNNAARQFNDFVRRGAGVSLSSDSFHPGLGVDDDGRLKSLLDRNSPMLDLNNPQIGVHSQIMFGEGIRQRRTPGSAIPEVTGILAELERQIQAGYVLQNGEWIQTQQNIPQTTTASLPRQTLRFTIDSTTFTSNNIPHTLEAAPFITADRTMVPLRVISEALGATDIQLSGDTISLTINGETITMTVNEPLPNNMGTPVIVSGRTFVPLAYIVDVLGAQARWDGNTRTAYIYIM